MDAEGKLYWTDVDRGILRANLDDSGAELLVAMGIYDPRGIAVDGSGGAIYAVDAYPSEAKPNEIRRFNLDGSGGEVLALLGMRGALAIALDVAGGKIYWTAPNRDDPKEEAKIQRANLDGTGVEDLLTVADGLVSPQGIAVDSAAQRLYWTDQGAAKVQSANLDGSDVRDLVTADDGLVNPQGIAVGAGRIYWTDRRTDKIGRANLDGSGVRDLVTAGLANPQSLALDAEGGKLYWTDLGYRQDRARQPGRHRSRGRGEQRARRSLGNRPPSPLAARGGTRRRTESGEAPGWQGATNEHIRA